MAAARCQNNDALRAAFSFNNCLQLDEEELNQLREYVKERRRQYREQAGMYNRASANLATRAKTPGAPRALNKREKRRLRAFGGGAGKKAAVASKIGALGAGLHFNPAGVAGAHGLHARSRSCMLW